MQSKKGSWMKLIGFILLCEIAGGVGSIFTTSKISTWYETLVKPAFNPPNWVFGPVWTTLFALMGISLYLISLNKNNKKAYSIFTSQLLLNILWSIIFFGLQSPVYAMIEIVILWTAIIMTIIEFKKISKTASYLLIPYILWVSFAMILNLNIAVLN